jgi:MFS family permease
VSPILADRPFVRATVVNFFFFASLNGFVLLPLHIQQLGGTEIEIGIVMGLYSGVGIVTQPLLGPWIDAVGRKPFMLLGIGLVMAGTLLAMVAPAVGALAVVRTVQGLGFSAFFVANFSYVVDLIPPAQRGWALGIYGLSGFLSTALSPLLGEWLVRRFGFRALFGVSLALAAVAAALAWQVRERPRSEPRTVRALGRLSREMLGDVLQRHMGVTLFFGLGTGTIFAFLPTFAESLGIETLALFYTAYSVAAMAVRVAGGRLIDTHGRRAVIVPSMFVQVVATGMLAALGLLVTRTSQVPALPVLFVAGLLSGAAHGFLYPGLAALATDNAAESRRGTVIGVFSAMFLVGQTAGAFTFGAVAHALGYGLMWTVLAGLLAIGAVMSLYLDAGQPVRRELPAGPRGPEYTGATPETEARS